MTHTTDLLPQVACTEGACLHADPARPCTCTACHGAGHGHLIATARDRGAATTSARFARFGGAFAALATAGGLYVEDEEW